MSAEENNAAIDRSSENYNAAIVRSWFERVFNQRNTDEVEKIMSPDHTFHDETLSDFPSLATKEDTDSFLDV
jgi:hypothetical protein